MSVDAADIEALARYLCAENGDPTDDMVCVYKVLPVTRDGHPIMPSSDMTVPGWCLYAGYARMALEWLEKSK